MKDDPSDIFIPVSDQKIHQKELDHLLHSFLEFLNSKRHTFTEVKAISNPSTSSLFVNSLKLMASRHTDSRSLFQREDWKDKDKEKNDEKRSIDLELRKKTLTFLGDYVSQFRKQGWNTGDLVHLFFFSSFSLLLRPFLNLTFFHPHACGYSNGPAYSPQTRTFNMPIWIWCHARLERKLSWPRNLLLQLL